MKYILQKEGCGIPLQVFARQFLQIEFYENRQEVRARLTSQ